MTVSAYRIASAGGFISFGPPRRPRSKRILTCDCGHESFLARTCGRGLTRPTRKQHRLLWDLLWLAGQPGLSVCDLAERSWPGSSQLSRGSRWSFKALHLQEKEASARRRFIWHGQPCPYPHRLLAAVRSRCHQSILHVHGLPSNRWTARLLPHAARDAMPVMHAPSWPEDMSQKLMRAFIDQRPCASAMVSREFRRHTSAGESA